MELILKNLPLLSFIFTVIAFFVGKYTSGVNSAKDDIKERSIIDISLATLKMKQVELENRINYLEKDLKKDIDELKVQLKELSQEILSFIRHKAQNNK